jgi:hypothetical protein
MSAEERPEPARPSLRTKSVVAPGAFLMVNRSEFLLDAPNFVFHHLFTVDPSSESHAGGNSRHTRGMQGFMALLHGGEDQIPVTLDVCAVCVKVGLEPCCRENTLTNCNLLGNRHPDADRNDAQICNDSHIPIVIAPTRRPCLCPWLAGIYTRHRIWSGSDRR